MAFIIAVPARFCYDGDVAEIGQHHNPKQLRRQLFAGLVLLTVIGVLVFYWYGQRIGRPFDVPGTPLSGELADRVVDREVINNLDIRMQSNLGTDTGLLSWYQQENRELAVPADRSLHIYASEQIRFGIWLVEQEDKSRFKSWLSSFQRNFISPDGLVYEQRQRTPDTEDLQPADLARTSWPDTLLYVRALAMAYSRWPQQDLDRAERAALESLSQLIGDSLTADSRVVIPTAAPTVDPGEPPPPRPSETTTPDPNAPKKDIIRLYALDLLTIKQMAVLDDRYLARYQEALALAEGGLISDDLPLYAASYFPENAGYVRFEGTVPVIELESSLLVALHLAEVGHLDPRTLSWLSEHLLNDGALYETYHIAQGQATSTKESLVGYALTARIARIVQDPTLYSKAVERLQWHLATSQTSQVRGAVFRQSDEGVVSMTALDNIWALLAFS